MSAFRVLFVQTFAKDLDPEKGRDFLDNLTCAFLLNLLFLVKISGLILGFAIVPAGYMSVDALCEVPSTGRCWCHCSRS